MQVDELGVKDFTYTNTKNKETFTTIGVPHKLKIIFLKELLKEFFDAN